MSEHRYDYETDFDWTQDSEKRSNMDKMTPEEMAECDRRGIPYLKLPADVARYFDEAEAAAEKCSKAIVLATESGWTGTAGYDRARAIVEEGPKKYAKALEKAKRKRQEAQRDGTPFRGVK
jgi:hypothetical protein